MANELRFRSVFDTTAVMTGLKEINAGMKGTGATITSSFSAGSTAVEKATGKLSGLGTALGHAKSQITGVVSSLGVMVGVGGLLGVATGLDKSVTAATDFGHAMELLKTQTGASQTEVDNMTSSVLELSKTLPTGPEDLATALYHVESAGIRGGKALDILRVASEGAATGGADLESVTNALIAANQSGVKGVKDMGSAMGTLNAIVGAGNMRMQDLADAMGTGVLSTAKNYGVTIQSVGAALASMTDQGIPAVDAATRLNSAMRLMAAPTSKAITELKSIGLGQYQLASDMRGPGGMLAAIADLKDHLDKSGLSATKQAALIAAAFGGKQSGAILTLIGNVDLLRQKQQAVNTGAAGFGAAVASASQTAQWKFGQFQSVLSSTAIKIGNVLLPEITQAVGFAGDWIASHQNQIVSAVENGVEMVRTVVGVAKDTVGAVASFWNGLPSGLRDVLVTGFVGNQTVKWLFGIDPAKASLNLVVSGLENALGAGVGKGLATAGLGKLFVQPVYVTNPGFGGGGGIPGAAGGAAEGAAGAGVVEGAAAAGAGEGVAFVSLGTMAGVLAAPLALAVAPYLVTALLPRNPADFTGKPTPLSHGMGNAPEFPGTPAATPGAPVPTHDQGWDKTFKPMMQNPQWLQKWWQGKAPTELSATTNSIIGALMHGGSTKGAVGTLTKTIEGGGGTAADWQYLLTLIPIMKDASPKFAGQLDKLGKWVTAHLPDKERVEQAYTKADQIVRSTEAVPQKLSDLKAIQANLLKHGDTNAAHQIAELIALVKKHQQITINVSTAWASGSGGTGAKLVGKSTTLKEFAGGGRLQLPALVGEKGPELIEDAPGGPMVTPLGGAGKLGGGGGSRPLGGIAGAVTVVLQLPMAFGMTPAQGQQVARAFGPLIAREFQRLGLLPRARAF